MTIALLASGSNAHGQLANGKIDDSHLFSACIFDDESSRNPITSEKVRHIASGANHTLVLSESIEDTGRTRRWLWGCGDAAEGQLGSLENGTEFRLIDLRLDENGFHGYEPRLVCSAWQTSYVVLSCEGRSDVLISMGSDDFGDLGVGRQKGVRAKPFHVVEFSHLLSDKVTWKECVMHVQSIAAGQHHVLARLEVQLPNQSLQILTVGWGAARHGQLGDASSLSRKTPFFPLPRIVASPSDDPIVSIALGDQHSVLRHRSGRLSGLGSNRKGQINGLDTFRDVSSIGCTWNGTYFITAGTLYATGSHAKGQLGRSSVPEPTSLVHPAPVELIFEDESSDLQIACGSEHVLALRRGGNPSRKTEVWGWGWNEHGNLGLGSTDDVHVPAKLWPPKTQCVELDGRRAVGIWAGCGTSWIALE